MIRRCVGSVVDLEALLLVSVDPNKAWRPEDLAQALYISSSAATQQFEKLIDQGFLHRGPTDCCQYRPDEKTAAAVVELAAAYEQWHVRVIEYIYSRPSESVYGFARAFKIKGHTDERDE